MEASMMERRIVVDVVREDAAAGGREGGVGVAHAAVVQHEALGERPHNVV